MTSISLLQSTLFTCSHLPPPDPIVCEECRVSTYCSTRCRMNDLSHHKQQCHLLKKEKKWLVLKCATDSTYTEPLIEDYQSQVQAMTDFLKEADEMLKKNSSARKGIAQYRKEFQEKIEHYKQAYQKVKAILEHFALFPYFVCLEQSKQAQGKALIENNKQEIVHLAKKDRFFRHSWLTFFSALELKVEKLEQNAFLETSAITLKQRVEDVKKHQNDHKTKQYDANRAAVAEAMYSECKEYADQIKQINKANDKKEEQLVKHLKVILENEEPLIQEEQQIRETLQKIKASFRFGHSGLKRF